MDDMFTRVAGDLVGRVTGPMKFRLVLQPVMAAILAIHAGLRDAREGRPPYFWAIITEPALRGNLIKEGWRAVSRVFIFAVIIDAIYQYIEYRWFYPFEAIIVAVILALVPYVLIRGPVSRIARR
jgi:hypothetical protein